MAIDQWTPLLAVAAAGAVSAWVLPWHVPKLRPARLQWTDRTGKMLAGTGASALIWAPWAVAFHDWPFLIESVLIGGSGGYALWRAWREHQPPRRRLRDRAGAVVRKLIERMGPASPPIPIRAVARIAAA